MTTVSDKKVIQSAATRHAAPRPPVLSAGRISVYALLIAGSVLFMIPFGWMISASLKTEAQAESSNVSLIAPEWLKSQPLQGDPVTKEALPTAVRNTLDHETAGGTASALALKGGRYWANAVVDGDHYQILIAQDGGLLGKHLDDSYVQWHNYPKALAEMGFKDALANTVVVTTLVVLGQIISCSLVGFGFARFRFRGKGPLFMIMISTMMLPAQVTMIPVFVFFREIGWIDTFLPLIVPAWLASPFFVFMFRQFFSQIPEELIEAARIDGASSWTIYWRMMLPLSGPVIAIVAIYTFLGAWNDFMGPLIYLNSPANRTLALALNDFKGQYGLTNANLLMAASFVAMLPCIVIFFACQRYFVQSVAMTGLKS